ncbi:MAG: glycosyltransferase family 1 protein [Pseudomonadales bacterium]|nr:glycosyltransferase family 1 protein [Pseudomonadales bacterium]
MKLLVVSDAWLPQTNGVVTTLTAVLQKMPALGIETTVIHPELFKTLPLPSYPEIRIARNPQNLKKMINAVSPHAIHIATEGPLGIAARRFCVKNGHAFTTSLHTKFPEYINLRLGIPLNFGYRFLRWFHHPASSTLVTTKSHHRELTEWGLSNLVVWGRGVDTQLFKPNAEWTFKGKPKLLYVGRIAVEKNIEAFLKLDLEADKVVVGDGPAKAELAAKYPEARWLGYRHGAELVHEYANADVFVFPSKTDTFGLVMLEAMACGTPVAGYNVTGPKDLVENGVNGFIDSDLKVAVAGALTVDRNGCRVFALKHDWTRVAVRFAHDLVDSTGATLLSCPTDTLEKMSQGNERNSGAVDVQAEGAKRQSVAAPALL